MQLVFKGNKLTEQPYTLSTVIAECADVQHKNIRDLIYKYKEDLEEFGVLAFETDKPQKGSKGGRPRKIYRLNEQQATLLITWLDNTVPVRAFKKNLVKAFYEMKKELANFKIQRAIGKPQRKELTDAISEWEHKKPWSYKHLTDLLFKSVTGMNAKQIKDQTGYTTALDALDAVQLKAYQAKEQQMISLIELELKYSDIRNLILPETKRLKVGKGVTA